MSVLIPFPPERQRWPAIRVAIRALRGDDDFVVVHCDREGRLVYGRIFHEPAGAIAEAQRYNRERQAGRCQILVDEDLQALVGGGEA